MRLLLLASLGLLIAWGLTARPGRPLTWSMYAGSSKAFLWSEERRGRRALSHDELRLAPDAHYLTPGDLDRLLDGAWRGLPVGGLLIGSRGDCRIDPDGEHGPVTSPLTGDEALASLADALRRTRWQPQR